MAETGLESFFAELASEGQAQGAASFTLESSKAREKLRKFALEHPENYVLMLVAGLVALGGRRIVVTVDADDLILESEVGFARQAFEDLWLYVAGGKGQGDALGFRLLAIAMLTSVRFSRMEWSVQSQDEGGPWIFYASVAGGKIGRERLQVDPEPVEGVRIWAKRKSLSQVTQRFLSNLTRRAFRRRCPEESLLEQRVCLPGGGTLEVNGRQIASPESGRGTAVAVLTSGGSPPLARASYSYLYKKEHTITTLMVDPENKEVPGQGRELQWIWNGLLMESTDLDMSYSFCRAFVWAPELRVDMSFSALVASRERDQLVRCARDSVREMLKLYAEEMKEPLQSEILTAQQEWGRRALLEVVSTRIDTQRDMRRFGSFNRALVNCPLFWGSEADGSERRYSFGELWERLLERKPLATFQSQEEWRRVPIWPDRPLVLFTDREERRILERKFGKANLASADTLANNLERMRAGSTPLVRPDRKVVAVEGSFDLGGVKVEWYARAQGGGSFPWGSVRVHKGEQLRFEDQTLPLWGILLIAEADWEADHQGRLKDKQLRQQLCSRALLALATDLSERSHLDAEELWLGSMILESLKGFSENADPKLRNLAWVVCRTTRGERVLTSPDELIKLCASLGAPLYIAEPGGDPGLSLAPPEWANLRLPEVSTEARIGLEKWLQLELRSARGLKVLAGSERVVPDERTVHTHSLEFDLPEGVKKVTMFWQHRSTIRRSMSVLTHSFGRGLEQLFEVVGWPGLMEVEWTSGWPDGTGLRIANKEQRAGLDESIPSLLTRFAQEFLSQASPHQLRELHPACLSFAVMACLNDDPLSVRSDYQTVRLDQVVVEDGVANYFTSHEGFGQVPVGAIFAPSEYSDYLALLLDVSWTEVQPEGSSSPSPAPPPEEPEPELQLPEPEPQLPEPEPEPEPEQPEPEPVPVPVPVPLPGPTPTSAMAQDSVTLVDPAPLSVEAPGEPDRVPDAEPQPESAALAPIRSLQEELLSWPYQNRLPFRDEFMQYLSGVTVDETLPELLVFRGGPVLGAPWLARCEQQEVRLASLSALFSLFNRERTEVDDDHERRFHRMLIQRSLKLWPGKSFT